jgi:hypothetical protein
LCFEHGEQEVVGAITHEAHAIEPVAAAAQRVVDSGELPRPVDGFRIITETGAELCGWPNSNIRED